ncbi:sensor histidine kinase [Geothrix limicola]|uniref:sensor histidine kinase n=1 Tax=Geothrix limicola TaxID=2927978 RepID=UPI0025558EF7|nr:HAMP domain-containing sensor histidine kinase [Geothrix limicola]
MFGSASILLLVPSALPPAVRVGVPTLIYLVLLPYTGLEAFRRARREPLNRWGWILVGCFFLMVSFALATALRQQFVQGFFIHHPPLSQLSGWTLSILPVAASLVGFRSQRPREPGRRGGALLDGIIFATALYLMFWMWVVKPLLPVAGDPQTQLLLQAFFLLIACSLGLACHALIARQLSLDSPVGILALALGYFALTVPFWAYAILGGTFHIYHPSRVIGVPFWAMLWWATQAPWSTRPSTSAHRILLLLLPYLPVVLAFGGALATYLPAGAHRDGMGLGLLIGLALLVLLRQGLLLWDYVEINRHLESKVEIRTRELAETQSLVLRTQRMNLLATMGAGLAHDLNNLLTAALGYLGLAAEVHPGRSEQDLGRLETALVRAGELTQRMMATGRPEGPGLSILDLTAHICGLEPVLRALIPKSLGLIVVVPDHPLLVRAQGTLIDQIVVNLVGNAKDATPPGGSITVRLGSEGPGAVLEVEDTGSGMPPQVLAHLFEAFFTTKEAGKGTGLGLGSVKAVVDDLGGRIQVHTEVGRGSRFRIEFPPPHWDAPEAEAFPVN